MFCGDEDGCFRLPAQAHDHVIHRFRRLHRDANNVGPADAAPNRTAVTREHPGRDQCSDPNFIANATGGCAPSISMLRENASLFLRFTGTLTGGAHSMWRKEGRTLEYPLSSKQQKAEAGIARVSLKSL